MSSPTTSLPTALSTSAAGIASKAPAPLVDRVLVRRRAVSFVASKVMQRGEVETVNGTRVVATPGDWLITQGKMILEVLPDKVFPGPFELVHEGALQIAKTDCETLDESLGLGATRSPRDLLLAVQRLARIRIGEVEIRFTPGQLEELQQRATKRGRTVQAELEAVVARIRDELFWRG